MSGGLGLSRNCLQGPVGRQPYPAFSCRSFCGRRFKSLRRGGEAMCNQSADACIDDVVVAAKADEAEFEYM